MVFPVRPSILTSIHRLANVAPLTAALIAPLAVLLDIPALTEKWYIRNGEPQPDPRASLILSGLSLGFSVIANVLLAIRFSLRGERWMIATQISVACWIVKVVTGITNLVVFGALTRNQPQFSYGEGFWSAVVSVIASGIILSLLVLHWAVEFKRAPSKDGSPSTPARLRVRVAGRHFMLQNTMLIALIALTALIFSRIEQWTYLQGIYFTIVTFLTVGFGDFSPSKTSTKVLLFPLVLLGITLLTGCISMIVTFFHDHQKEHKAQARAEREKAWQISEMKSNEPSLEREVAFLSKLHEHEGWREQGIYLAQSLAGFLLFWFAGAAIFGASWSYGDSLYFCYVFFLSIGYGDFAPVSPAGRVIFIVYSILAVPIMASFAVQAIQNILEQISQRRMDQRRASIVQNNKGDPENNSDKDEIDEEHSTLVLRHHLHKQKAEANGEVTIPASDLEGLLEHSLALERITRRLLVAHLEEGTRAQILLRADWNLQLRNMQALEAEMKKQDSRLRNNDRPNGMHKKETNEMLAMGSGISKKSETREEHEESEFTKKAVGGMGDEETLNEVREFREHVAGMLAVGSRLRGLEGIEKYMFERRRKEAEDKARAYRTQGSMDG